MEEQKTAETLEDLGIIILVSIIIGIIFYIIL